MMERYTLKDAQDHLKKLLDDAHGGKTVVILGENGQQFQLVPTRVENKSRKAGSARGQIKMAPDFDAPLSDFDDYSIDRRW